MISSRRIRYHLKSTVPALPFLAPLILGILPCGYISAKMNNLLSWSWIILTTPIVIIYAIKNNMINKTQITGMVLVFGIAFLYISYQVILGNYELF